jgi:hypothetical protein
MDKKEFLIIAIATLITVIAWVGFDIYHKRETVSPPANIEQLSEPIDPNFDLSALEK